jgi:hypothetical protein
MDQAKTFPCPGCGAHLDLEETTIACVPLEGGAGRPTGIGLVGWETLRIPGERTISHQVYGADCNGRALVAAVRSLDAGQRDAAQLQAARNAVIDQKLVGLVEMLREAFPSVFPPLPTREDFQDRDPLIGNACVHGIRVDVPCAKCDDVTTHCAPPCGGRHDQPITAHVRGCAWAQERFRKETANTPADSDPAYGPCSLCRLDHPTEDHEAGTGGV